MTHDEEYLMLNEAKIGSRCSGRCSGIGAIEYTYDVTYNSRFGIKKIEGKTLREISWQLDEEVSPIYNKQGLTITKSERYGGPTVAWYFYEYDPRTEHWTRKRKITGHYN